MQFQNSEDRLPSRLTWREQTQRHTTQLLAQGRAALHNIDLPAWQSLKSSWQTFIAEQCRSLQGYKGKPIHARLLKETRHTGFRVQNIIFESMPGWQVALDLFLPAHDGPYVPLICPCGHGPKWEADHQLPPQVLARNGFAVALFDAPMFGEKAHHNDHFIQGSQAGMLGMWSNLFFLIDAVRSADYLQTREDMDFSHGCGVTGVSGGGFTTLFMAQVDERVKAIAPVCCVAPFGGHNIAGLYTGCPENYMTGQAALGLDFDHLVCLAAPLPCLVVSGTQDTLFRPALVQKSVDQARSIYALEGVPDRLAACVEDSPHSYTPTMAFEVARWMHRWLLNRDTAIKHVTPEVLSQEELNCGIAETTHGMLEVIQREVATRIDTRQAGTTNADLLAVLRLSPSAVQPEMEVQALPDATWGYEGLHKHLIHSANDLTLPVVEAIFPASAQGTLVCFSDAEKTQVLHQIGGLFGLRHRIVSADLRGFGDLEPLPTNYDLYSWCGVDRALSDLLQLSGQTALGQQTSDALRVIEMAQRSAADTPDDLTVYGHGEAALAALFAGLLSPHVKRIVLDAFLCSFAALAVESAPVWKRYQYLPDVLKHFDLPQLLAARPDKQFLLINPLDAHKRRLDEVDALKLYGLDAPHVTLHVDYAVQIDAGFRAESTQGDAKSTLQAWLDTPPTTPQPPDPQLALHGGRPVRQTPLPTKALGADLTGLNELYYVQRAIGTKTLFRHYGIGHPVMAETFERRVREMFGTPYAMGVTSGSAALVCALAGLGVGPGDEVILPAFSWFSCYNAIALHGALPVFCDIDRSLDIDPADFERKITPRTRAVIAVHYQGSPADLSQVLSIARQHQLYVLEDCAQSIGARYQGRALGTLGDVGIYSLQGNKLITSGEGGIVVSNDPLIFERAVRYQDLGFVRPTFKAQLGTDTQLPDFTGSQYRMNELTAAVALAQLEKLDWIISRCHRSWCLLREKLSAAAPDLRFRLSNDVDGDAGITLYLDMQTPAQAKPFAEALAAEGIPLGPSSGMTNLLTHEYITGKRMVHAQLAPFGPGSQGEQVTYTPAQTPNAAEIIDSMVAIGIGPRFTPRDVQDVAQAVTKVWTALR
jgi:8-amino-3,8-dideoxy-alpha-D-manno-octulosonate transaminase